MAAPVEPRARTRMEIAEALAVLLEDGTPIVHACHLEGVSEAAYHLWVGNDEEFAAVVNRARAKAAEEERRHLKTLIREGVGTSNAQLHYMARQWPQVYGETKRVELTGRDGGKVETSVAVTIEQATRAAAGESPEED